MTDGYCNLSPDFFGRDDHSAFGTATVTACQTTMTTHRDDKAEKALRLRDAHQEQP